MPVTAEQIEEAAGLRQKKARKVKASEIERMAGFGPSPLPEKIERPIPASTTKVVPFAAEPSKIQRFVKHAFKQFETIPELGRAVMPGAFPEGIIGTAQATLMGLGAAPYEYALQGLETLRKGAQESKNPLVTSANFVRAVLPGLSHALEASVSGQAYESPEKAAETVVGALFDFPIVAGIKAKLAPKEAGLPDVSFVEMLADEAPKETRAEAVKQVTVELDRIDKMNRLQASEELLALAKERGLDEREAGKAIAGLGEKEVKEHLRRNSTERVTIKVLFGEEAAKPQEIKTPEEGKVQPEAETLAKQLGLEYGGAFEGFTKKSGEVVPPQHTFTDPQSGSTFVVSDLAEVPLQLAEMRQKFKADEKPAELDFHDYATEKLRDAGIVVDLNELRQGHTEAVEDARLTEAEPTLKIEKMAEERRKADDRRLIERGPEGERRGTGKPITEEERAAVELVAPKVDIEAIAKVAEAAKLKPVINPGAEPTAAPLPIEEIRTDVDRFQNRQNEVAPATVQAIVENFHPNKFDPIVVWKDPVDGQTYVLSGHSRLEGMKQRGEATVPARYFQGTAEEAARFATIEANRLATKESVPETIRAYRKAKTEGIGQSQMRDLFGSDIGFLDAAQNLDPKGQFVELLSQPPSALESFPYIKRFARWAGELRALYPDKLTNVHEQQLFDFFYKTERKNMDISKENFFHLVQKQVDTFDWTPEKVLSLKRTGELLTGTKARGDTAPAEAEIEKLKLLQEEARTVDEHQALQREIDRIRQSIAEMVQNQGSLFETSIKVEPKYGESNAIVSLDRHNTNMKKLEDMSDPSKLSAQFLPGFEPEIIRILLEEAIFHIEAGAREFGAWSKELMRTLPADWQKRVKPVLKDLYDEALRQADDWSAKLTRIKNDAAQRLKTVQEEMAKLGEAERLGLEELEHLRETGHLAGQEEFREATPFPEEVIRKTLVSPEIMAAKSADFVKHLEGVTQIIDELGLSAEQITDILGQNIYSSSAIALRKLVAELKESTAEFAKVGRSASKSLLERKKAVEMLQQVAYKLGPIKDQITGIKWVKEKRPILNHFAALLTDAKFRKNTTASEHLGRATRAWTSNLFRLFSYTADFVGNATVAAEQFLGTGGIARDMGRFIKRGAADYFGHPYAAAEEGTVRWSYTKGFLKSIAKNRSLKRQRRTLAGFPPEIRSQLGFTLMGEKMGAGLPKIFLDIPKGKGKFLHGLGAIGEHIMADPAKAKMVVDQFAKTIAAEAELIARADIEAAKLGLEPGTGPYEEFVTLWRQKLPAEDVRAVVRRGQESSFSVQFENEFMNAAGRWASHPFAKLLLHPFLFWKLQFTRWAGEMLGFQPDFVRRVYKDAQELDTKEAMYKNLDEFFARGVQVATGYGGLWLLYNMFLDEDEEDIEAGRMDFERMRYVFPDGSYVNVGMLEPIVTGLVLARLMQYNFEDDPKLKDKYAADVKAGLKYTSVLGAGTQGQEGLVSGILPMVMGMMGDPNYAYRAPRDWNRLIVSLIPGNALLSSLKTLIDPQPREGVIGKMPFVSFYAEPEIDPTTGEPKKKTVRIPGPEKMFDLFGFRTTPLEGGPLPGSAVEPSDVERILNYGGRRPYPSWTQAVAGYNAISDAQAENPKLVREWLIELGHARQEVFQKAGHGLEDYRKMDIAAAHQIINGLDNLAVFLAQEGMNLKYETSPRRETEVRERGGRLEKKRLIPETKGL